jgi:hypothetical protein
MTHLAYGSDNRLPYAPPEPAGGNLHSARVFFEGHVIASAHLR